MVGFGEAGQAFAKGIINAGENVTAYDPRFATSDTALEETIQRISVNKTENLKQLTKKCNFIFLLVPGTVSESVAAELAEDLQVGSYVLDLTTSRPETKKRSSEVIRSRGGNYIDVSVMGTVATEKHKVPLLLAGESAEKVKNLLDGLMLNSKVVSDSVGAAASIKMLRSIFMKGIEALLFETMLTAEKYGVREDVLESIATTMRNNDFEKLTEILITTHMQHKERRHKEVQESISLVKEAGIDPFVTEGVLSFFSDSVERRKHNPDLSGGAPSILRQELQQKTEK